MQIANYFCYRLNMPLAWVATFVLPFDTTLARVATFVLSIEYDFGLCGNVRATV